MRAAVLPFLLLLVSCPESPPPPIPPGPAGLDPDLCEAIEQAAAGVRDRPREAEAWGRLGTLYEANDLHAPAAECYRRSCALDGASPRWPYRLARALTKLGREGEALEWMSEAARRDPALARAHWRMGMLHLARGATPEARAAFERATGADPRDPAGWTGLAQAHLQREDADAAIEAARRALSLRPDDRHAHLLLGTAFRAAGRTGEARAELALGQGGVAAVVDPWEDEVLARRVGFTARIEEARARLTGPRPTESIAALERLRAEQPGNVGVLNNLALAFREVGRNEEALATLDAALAVEPDSTTTRTKRGLVLAGMGRPREALEELDRVLELDPLAGLAWELRGVILREQGSRTEALAAFRRKLEVDDRDPIVRVWMGDLELDLGLASDAARTLEAACRAVPPPPEAFAALAVARARLGEVDAAGTALARATALLPADSRRLRAARAEVENARRASGGVRR